MILNFHDLTVRIGHRREWRESAGLRSLPSTVAVQIYQVELSSSKCRVSFMGKNQMPSEFPGAFEISDLDYSRTINAY